VFSSSHRPLPYTLASWSITHHITFRRHTAFVAAKWSWND
jgi:hypothetical protein